MPEIKKVFLRGKMNKDLDERLLPDGEYRDASNIQVSSTESSDAGTIQNILGNKKLPIDANASELLYLAFGNNSECLGSIADEDDNKIYFLIKGDSSLATVTNAVIEYDTSDEIIKPILIDSRETKQLKFCNIDSFTGNGSTTKYTLTETPKSINSLKIYISDVLQNISTYSLSSNVVTFSTAPSNNANIKIEIIEKITGIAIVENFLVFTDGFNEPKIIDLSFDIDSTDNTKYKNNLNFTNTLGDFTTTTLIGTSAFQEADITLIKKKPNSAPKIGFTLSTDNSEITGIDRKFEDKFVRFAYRWKFKNGQYSVFSPFSEPLFFPSEDINYDIETGFNKQMVNNIKLPRLYDIETSLNDIDKVEILYKESNNANANIYLYKTLSKAEAATSTGTNLTDGIDVGGESLSGVISENELLRHYDNIPFAAKAVETVGNRIVFGNYKDGLNCDFDISFNSITTEERDNVDVEVMRKSTGDIARIGGVLAASNISDKASIKTGRKYQFGVVLEDEYGRQSPVLTDNDSGFEEIEFNSTAVAKHFKVNMAGDYNDFDERIKRFKYYIKESSGEYYNVIVKDVYENTDDNGSTVWLVLPSYEINKLDDEDFIILKKAINNINPLLYSGNIREPGASSDTAVTVEDFKFKVLSIKSSKPDSLGSSKKFEDSFFVKIKNNAVVKEYLLAQQGLENTTSTGSLNIFEDDFNNNYPGGGVEIGYLEDNDQRYTYYFLSGRVYEKSGTKGDDQSSTVSDSAILPANVPSTLGFTPSNTSGWYDANETFSDTTGDVAAIYYRTEFSSFNFIKEVVIKYDPADTSAPQGQVTSFSPAVFETIPEDTGLDIYYEASNSFPIADWGNVKELNYSNCFVMGSGVESDRIKDDYNEATIGKGVRVSTTINNSFTERTNSSGLIYSGVFNSETNLNELNKFNTANTITKVVNPKYSSIQKLHSRDNDLVVLCEDKIIKLPVNKQILFNADGSENLVSSDRVLGTEIPYDGNYGISKNPESFAAQGYRSYFTDKARGVVLRLTKNGVTIISDNGMTDYFRENLAKENIIIGSYDIYSEQYILSFQNENESLSFKEDIKGWVSRLSFVPESGASVNGNYYTFKKGHIYIHNAPDADANKFYGDSFESGIQLIFNQEPSTIKNFKTISYEGTEGWATIQNGIDIIKTDQQKGQINQFIEKEGKYFGIISGINTELNTISGEELDSRLKDFSIQGLGNISSHSGVSVFTCSLAQFNIIDSNTLDSNGDNITSLSKSSVQAGTLVSVDPANIQSGLRTYTANIRVPNGYSNTGEIIQCTDTATGTSIDPEFTCSTANFQITSGTVGNATAGTVDAGTIASISPSTYQSGSTVYTATINIPASGYSNSGTINCTDTLTASEASCAFSLTPGNTYSAGSYTLTGTFSGTDYINSDTITLSVVQGNIGIGSAGSSNSVNTTKSALAGGLTIYSNEGVEVTATITSGLCSGEIAETTAPQVATVVISAQDTAFTYDSVTLTATGTGITSYQWYKDNNSGFTPSSSNAISNEISDTLNTSEISADTIYYKVKVNGVTDSAEHDIVYSNRTLISNLKYKSGDSINPEACTSTTFKNVYVKPLNATLTTATDFSINVQGDKTNIKGTYSDGINNVFVNSNGEPTSSGNCTGGNQLLGLRDCRNTISEIIVDVDLNGNSSLSAGSVISFTDNIGGNQYFYVNSIKDPDTDIAGYARTLSNTYASCLVADPPTLALGGTTDTFVNTDVSLDASVSHIPQGASFTYIYKKSTDGGTSFSDINTTTNQNITDSSASSTATTLKYKVAIQGTSIESPVKDVIIRLYYQHTLRFAIDTGAINDDACTSGTTRTVFANQAPYGNNNRIPATVTQLYHTNTGLTSGFVNGTYSDGDIHGYFNSSGQLINNWEPCAVPASPSVEIQYPQGTSTNSVNANAYATVNLYALASNMAEGQTVNYTWTKNSSTVQGPNTDNTYDAALTSSEINGYTSPITHTYGVQASDGTNNVADTISVTFTVTSQKVQARLCPSGSILDILITNASGYSVGNVVNLTGSGLTTGCYEITGFFSGQQQYSATVSGEYPFAPSSSCCDCTGCSASITDDTVGAAEVGDEVEFTASTSGFSATNYAFYTRTEGGSYPSTANQSSASPVFRLTQSSAGLIYVKVIATATGVSREAETNQNWTAPAVSVERFYQSRSLTSNCGDDDSIIEVRYTSLLALPLGTVFDTGGSICYKTTSSGSTSGNSSSYQLQQSNFYDNCTDCQAAQSADCSFTLFRSGYDSTNGGVTVQATFGLGHTNTTSVSFSVSGGSVSPGTATKAQLQGNGIFLTLSPSVTLTGTVNSSDSCNGTTDDVDIPVSTCNTINAYVTNDNPATSSSAANELCGAFLPLQLRVNGTTIANSSRVYSGSGCTTLLSGTKYISQDSNFYYIWNGTSLSGPYVLNCP